MFPKEIEVILTRHLASCLAMPIIIVDPDGNLVFYNEPAEAILGRRFEESGEVPASEWAQLFKATDDGGQPVNQLPLQIAVTERHPVYGTLWIRGLDGMRRHIAITAIPLIGQSERFLGGMAILWEAPES